MKILLAIAVRDYGRPDAATSYEYNSWYRPLRGLGHDVQVFDTFDSRWAGDRQATATALIDAVSAEEPQLVLTMLIEDEIPMSAIDSIRGRCQVANWFADDTWRFRAFSRHIASHFDWIVTTSRAAFGAYADVPATRPYFSGWGFDPHLYHRVDIEPSIDVGFVGQRHGRRGAIVEGLRRSGLAVDARGSGWDGGRVDDGDIAAHFASTRVNLNFLESSAGPFQRRGLRFRGSWRADMMINRFVLPPRQLKARPFEITACGGFLLTNDTPELAEFFEPDAEVATYSSVRDLGSRIRYFLENEDERSAIAAAGLRRSAAYSWPIVLSDLLDRAM